MKAIEQMTDEEILAEARVRYSAVVRSDREREALGRMTIPERKRHLRDLWDAEGPFVAFPLPTPGEERDLDRIEADVERETAPPGASTTPVRQRSETPRDHQERKP